MLSVPPLEQNEVILAGFQDCTEEAIRYLVDVERLPEDDPLVIGLRQHLLEKQMHLNYERILQEHLSRNNSETASRTSSNSVNSDTVALVEDLTDSTTDNFLSHDHHLQSRLSEMTPDIGSEVMTSEAHVVAVATGSEGEEAESMQVSLPPLYTIDMLAQNNPAIASLTQELLALIETEVGEPINIED